MPLSDALASGVGITPAYATLKHLPGKTTKGHRKQQRRQHHHHPYDSGTNSDDEVLKKKIKQTKTDGNKWMTLDKIDPERYWKRKIVGRGDMMSQFNNQVPVIGEKSQYGDPTVPEFKQRGP